MRIKVSMEHIIIDHPNRKIHEIDLKVENSRIIMSLEFFLELEEIFANIKKGRKNFKGDFEFRTK